MSFYDLGDTVVLKVTPKDANGATVTPTSVTVTLPDATTSTPTITGPDGNGQFTAPYPTTLSGLHRARWIGPGFANPDSFTVWPEQQVLSVTDVRGYLMMTDTTFATESVSDDKLRQFMAAAEAAIANRCGPMVPTTVTSIVTSMNSGFVLPTAPALSVTSMTGVLNGATVDVSQFNVRPSGVVSLNNSYGTYFSPGDYTIVYQAGRLTVPNDLYQAAMELTRHFWLTQRGGSSRPARSGDALSNTLPGFAYTWPTRVEQLIAPYVQLGFA